MAGVLLLDRMLRQVEAGQISSSFPKAFFKDLEQRTDRFWCVQVMYLRIF